MRWKLLLILPFLLVSSFAVAQEDADLSDSLCLECHSDTGLSKKTPDGKEVSLYVNGDTFKPSVHGGNSCISCHDDISEIPHPEALKKVECATCHSSESDVFLKSSHGKAFQAKAAEAPQCKNCHGYHDVLPKSDPASRTHPLNQVEICTGCHLNAAIAQKYHLPPGDKIESFKTGIHGRGLLRSGLLVSATCVSCHSAHNVRAKNDPESTIYWAKIPQLCGTCHLGILEDFERSTHGAFWKKKSPLGPGCVTCHGSHGIEDPVTPSFQFRVPDLCATCHTQRAPTYKDNFHGQVVELGFAQSATCADCHTAHNNLPANDPRSTVHPSNLAKTCGACHGQVSASYITYDPHLDPTDPSQNRIIYYIWLFFIVTIYFVFIFFGAHYLLWFQRSMVAAIRGEFEKHKPEQDQIYVRRFAPA
ncbi:MAG TPA: cytochrome c3 family protein, partial [Acidobacteriota bacterium]|nr:cytochrome c3 family protein [Acidobacteriota bacterium]